MLKVAVGHSHDPDSQAAIAEVLLQCQETLAGMLPSAGLLFAGIDFDHALILRQIQQTYGDLALIGCTTDGEISSVLGFERNSLALMLFCSDGIEIAAGVGYRASENSPAAIAQALTQARASLQQEPKFCLTLPDGLTLNGCSVTQTLAQVLGEPVPVFGGTAGDNWRFQNTYQFFQTEVLKDAIPLLLFAGPIVFAHGVAHGRSPIGMAAIVTKATANTIYEIDHQPALQFFQHFGIEPSIEYPLIVFEPGQEEGYIRGAYSSDPENGSVHLFAEVPEGATIQMTINSRDEVLAAAQSSLHQALTRYPGPQPTAALFFSCAGRRQILGSQTSEEHRLIQATFETDIPSLGFYTYGEIAPSSSGGLSRFHNETFVTLLLGSE